MFKTWFEGVYRVFSLCAFYRALSLHTYWPTDHIRTDWSLIILRCSISVTWLFAARQLSMPLNLVKSPLLHMQPLCFFFSLSPLTPCSCMPRSSFIGKKREMYEHPVFCLASQVMDLTIREYPAHLEPLHHFRHPSFFFFSRFFVLEHFHKQLFPHALTGTILLSCLQSACLFLWVCDLHLRLSDSATLCCFDQTVPSSWVSVAAVLSVFCLFFLFVTWMHFYFAFV